MSDILQRICRDKRDEVSVRERACPLPTLLAAAAFSPPPRGFIRRLQERVAAGGYGLIAEIKRASPSHGLIRADFDPVRLAGAYAAGGAACLSVLTDTPYFQGDDSYLTLARASVDLPVLRKDFILDSYQVVEARAIGADCILLILAVLDDATTGRLMTLAGQLGMDVLVEVHDRAELDRALALGAAMIGINNRNLKTLKVDLATTERLAPHAPADRLIVGESGLASPADLARLAQVGVRCFLIGEALMRQADVEAATRTLLAAPRPPH
jgi:indole-3-glycerol phosphate synthase